MRRIDSKGFKEFHQKRLDEKKFFAEKKLQEEKKILKEQKKRQEIKKVSEELRHNWRDDIDLQESNWSPTTGSGPTNSIAQRFAYSLSNLETGQPNTVTVSGLGGVESIPSTVSVDFGFGETEVVSAPTFSQLGLQGYAKPLGTDVRRRRDYEDVNPRLDASQEFARAVGADYMMNARVQSGEFTPEQQAAIDAWNDELRTTMDRHGREWEAVLRKDGVYDPKKHKALQARQGAEMDAIWSKEPKFDDAPIYDPYFQRIYPNDPAKTPFGADYGEVSQVMDGEKLLPQELQDILNRRRGKSPALGGTFTKDEKTKIATFMATKEGHDLLIKDPDTYDRLERALTGRIPPRNLYPGKTPQPKDYYGDFLKGGGMIDPSASANAAASAIRKLGDLVADALGAGDAKDVFDYYMNWAENPNSNPVNLTNKISPEGQAYLQKLAGDPSVQGLTGMRKAAALNQLYVADLNSGKIPRGLRNTLGMPDVNKGDGFNVDKNGKVTFNKAYDFSNIQDLTGADPLTKAPAAIYALTQGAHKHLVGGKESPTMNININVAAPSANANSVGQRGSDGGMTDAEIKVAQANINAARKAGKMSDIRGSQANKGFALDPKTGEPRYTGMNNRQYADAANKIADKYNKLRAPIERQYPSSPAPQPLLDKLNALNDAQNAEEDALAAKRAAQENAFNDALQDYNDKQDAANQARQDALDEIDNEEDPYSKLLAELGAKMEKLRREGKSVKRVEIIGPGEEGYVDTTDMANAIGYNRRIIYTAAAKELQKQIIAAQDAQMKWLNDRDKRREDAEKADYSDAGGSSGSSGKGRQFGGQGGLPIGSTTLRRGAIGKSAGAREPTSPENMSQSAALARQAASARMNPQQRRKRGMKGSTWDRINKYR